MELLKLKRLATLRTAIVASVGVHGALIVAATLLPLGAPRVEAAEVVTVEVVDVVAPPEEPAPSAPPPPAAPKPRAAPQALVETAPRAAEPAPVPSAAADETPPEPTAPVVVAGNGAPAGGPAGAAPAVSGGVPGGAVGGVLGGTGSANRPVDDTQRKVWLGRYREQMRGRIGAAFQYPAAARELELAGEVIVEITVDRAGALKRVRLHGSCPHALLCEDALRTVRAAAPYPPLPPDLAGDAVAIDVPLRYDFE